MTSDPYVMIDESARRTGGARPAVFLDRDGVLIANRVDHVKSPGEVVLLDGAAEAVRRLTQSGVLPVVVTNQAVVGRGQITLAQAIAVHRSVIAQFAEAGAVLSASLLCPHTPDDACGCRKPAPGMLLTATELLDLDLSRSCLVGDAMTDVAAAQAAGVPSVLVMTGRGGSQWRQAPPYRRAGVTVAVSLADAVGDVLRLATAGAAP